MNGLDDFTGADGALRELALFAGGGGGILGGKLLGWRTICAVEFDPYAAGVLLARQNDGRLAPFPVWDDVRTFDGRPWRGRVDVVSGGFPCQDISVAGQGVGIDGERSGLWSEMARIIGEVRPRFAFVENSPALVTRGLGRVLGDLAALGYDCRWTVLGAADVGAPHKRDRIWIVATDAICESVRLAPGPDMEPEEPERTVVGLHGCDGNVAHSDGFRKQQSQNHWHEERRRAGDRCEAVADSDRLTRHQRWPGNAEKEPGRRHAGGGGVDI